ncbi:MAG: beta-N-acetylhexosaminidase [Chloroflexi bacterium]|nr:beta-N-acetylhexosaminidase [Chloroflexota bacterium]
MSENTRTQLAQLICFNPAGATLTAEEEAFIAHNRVTSFVLFARNLPDISAAQRLIDHLHRLAGVPLIAVDQEGGRVTRLPSPATHFPSAMALGNTGSPDLARRAGQATARELRALRLNVALAPVMDVNSNPQNPVIGTRAFGDSPDTVSPMGVAWLLGVQGEGVAACAKHFPGHGDTHVDSHYGLPRIDTPRAALDRFELAPFRDAIAAGVEMVMPGHLLLSDLDDTRPASLSRRLITGLLRTEMGFGGVIISDALDMDAVALEYGIPGAAVEAALAGCDLVCPIVQHAETLNALEQALNDGRLTLLQVSESIRRTRRLRERVAALPPPDAAWLGAPAHRVVAREIARRAIRVADADGFLPQPDLSGWLAVEFALGKVTIAEGRPSGTGKLINGLRDRIPSFAGITLSFNPIERDVLEVCQQAENARGLIIATRQALHFPSQRELVRRCCALGKPTVIIALRDPYDLTLFSDARCTIATFDDSPIMIGELLNILTLRTN